MTPKRMNPKQSFKNQNDSSKGSIVARKNKKIKRKRITTCSRENVTKNKKKFIENNMIRKKLKKSNKYQIIQVMLRNKITLYFYILSL